MPLTFDKWFEENKGIGGTPADYATEYARYYHSELSRPPKDVVTNDLFDNSDMD